MDSLLQHFSCFFTGEAAHSLIYKICSFSLTSFPLQFSACLVFFQAVHTVFQVFTQFLLVLNNVNIVGYVVRMLYVVCCCCYWWKKIAYSLLSTHWFFTGTLQIASHDKSILKSTASTYIEMHSTFFLVLFLFWID